MLVIEKVSLKIHSISTISMSKYLQLKAYFVLLLLAAGIAHTGLCFTLLILDIYIIKITLYSSITSIILLIYNGSSYNIK